MEKKYLKQFIDLFGGLPSAGTFIDKGYDENVYGDIAEWFNSEIKGRLDKIVSMPFNDDAPGLLFDLFKEIEDNLYAHSDYSTIYIMDIIRQFNKLLKFIDVNSYNDQDDFVKKYGYITEDQKATLSTIIDYNERSARGEYHDVSITKQYVIWCNSLIYNFFLQLDAKCLSFSIDLMDIQDQLNIYPYLQRNTDLLIEMGYEKILKTLDKKSEKIKTDLSPHSPDLMSLKQMFYRVINELDLFYPLISTMYAPQSCENRDHELFKEEVKTFSRQIHLFILNPDPIDKVISQAKLFLDNDTCERFFQFCKNEILARKNRLALFLNNHFPIEEKEIDKIEEIFFANLDIGLYCFPGISILPNKHFPEDLCSGIQRYFDDFEKKIDELSIKKSDSEINHQNEIIPETSKTDTHIISKSKLKKCIKFLSLVETIVGANEFDEFTVKIKRFLLAATNEALLSSPEQISILLKRVNNMQSKFNYYFVQYPDFRFIVEQKYNNESEYDFLFFVQTNFNMANSCVSELKINNGAMIHLRIRYNSNILDEFRESLESITGTQVYSSQNKESNNVRPSIKIKSIPIPENDDLKRDLEQNIDNQSITFPEFLLHSKKNELAEKLKVEFKIEKGIKIRYMLEALQDHEPKLLKREHRDCMTIYKSLLKYFDRDIGTYNGIFNPEFKAEDYPGKPNETYEKIKIRLNTVLEAI